MTDWKPITRDSLFDVQRAALEAAQDKAGFALFLEQGLGKTRTVLQEFHELVGRDKVDILFIVCPRSLRGAWRDEALECGYPYPFVMVHDEVKALKQIKELKGAPCCVVIHYDLMLTRGPRLIEMLVELKQRIYIALDESVRIKRHDSKVGERVYFSMQGKRRVQKGVTKKGKPKYLVETYRDPLPYRRVLTGTPAPQGPHDLWNQFRVIGLMETTPFFAFRSTYCKMGGFMRKGIVGAKNLDILRHRTGNNVFRAKKVDWTDLPEKLWAHPRQIDLDPEQLRAYREIVNEFVLELGPDDYITVEMAITVKNKLQQICSGWVYDNEHNVRELVTLDKNPKLQDLREFIEGVDSKILVFYFFKPTRQYLEQLAESMSIGYTFLESGLKDAEFDARKKAFNEDPEIQVAFCQTDAVKEGHTLLGTKDRRCFNTYFLENTYSLYARGQAEDRNHRHGQTNPVTYHDVTTSKEDKAIIKALQRKGDLQEALLSEFTEFRKKK